MPGLEILNPRDRHSWKLVPAMENGLIALVGNYLEVLSNGLYKSVGRKVARSSQSGCVSVGSFHSLPMEERVEPALELLHKDKKSQEV
ncbi:hypothetical protein TIFTF001_003063 [Ficus carica]|uniref:Uncharacterized protein n=1 Tax=Ficus carica TaxID=3494 RepID=A0AA88D9I2_FICCA|nr:hypothetical protein TIFTF001_003063 [Ficus carica]